MKLTHSLGVKIAAVFLFALLTGMAFFGTSLTIAMLNDGFYPERAEAGPRLQEEHNAANECVWNSDAAEAKIFPLRYSIPLLTGIEWLCCAALFLFLLCAAGHREGREEAALNTQDKIPLDLYLLAAGFAATFLYWWLANPLVSDMTVRRIEQLILLSAALTVPALIVLAFCMTLATRIKTGTLWRNTVIYRVLRLGWRALCWMGRGIRTLCRNMSLIWQAILIYSAYALVMLLLCRETYYSPMATLFWMGVNMTVLLAVCFVTLQLSRLREGARRLAEGDLSYHVPTEHMFFELKRHGENLNSIGAGMTRAVEERIKSERLKTELITNVSHDIKTPLTSILNYVDLLKKEPAASETASEYIAVLDRQARRLKKLTEDVLEASKAATGNIKVELGRTDAVELLGQCLAEYVERFQTANLTAVMQTPGEPAFILAEGRLLWRVFDNLLGNIAKYAQPGTRVYAGVTREGKEVVIALKNISRDALNISEEELMERFVRGDSARTSEGSGLGLSIARSLTELQGGHFGISIDCDLFKAELRFAAVEET